MTILNWNNVADTVKNAGSAALYGIIIPLSFFIIAGKG